MKFPHKMSCLICNGDLSTGQTFVVREKGLRNLIKASIHRQDNLVDIFSNTEPITLHVACRQRYIINRENRKGELKFLSLTPNKPKPKEIVDFEYIPITNTNKETNIHNNNSTATLSNTENAQSIPIKSEDTLGIAESLPESIETYIPILIQAGTSTLSPDEITTSSEVKYSPETDGTKIVYIPLSIDNDAIEESNEPTTDSLTLCPQDNDEPSKPFPFKHKCFICTKDISANFIKKEMKKPPRSRIIVSLVSKEETKIKIVNYLSQLISTPEIEAILRRIKDVNLVEVGAGYHKPCYLQLFRQKSEVTSRKKGRPVSADVQAALDTIYRYIEESDRTKFTITELKSLCKEYQPRPKTIQINLRRKYGEKIYFTTISGRSTLCTIIKNASDVIRQLQTANGIKLPQVQNEKENDESAETKDTNAQVRDDKKEDSSKDLNKNDDDDFINSDDDDGFFADWLNPPGEFTDELNEENSKGNRNTLICRICLSSDRKLSALGDYSDIYRSMTVDAIENTASKQFLVCWECKALLKNVKQFQSKIQTAQKLWNIKKQPKCLSTLSITSPFSSVSYTPDNQNSEVYVEVEFFPKPDTEEMEIIPEYSENLSPDHNAEESQELQNNTDFDTFDNNRDAMDSDSSEDKDRTRRKLRRRTTNEAGKRSNEENAEIDDEVLPPEKDSDTSSSEVSDWEQSNRLLPTARKKKKENKETDQQRVRIPYTIIDLNYDVRMKMKRIAIPPHELDHWRERERNSVYFENLNGNKCLKCLCEVTDNHDEVFHSKTHPHICRVCESCFTTEKDLDAHIENHYYIYSCNICGYQCYNEQHMCDHADRHRTVVQCLECYAIKETLDILKEHYDEIHRYSECDYCGQRLEHKMLLEQHIQRYHTPLDCTICHANFPTDAQRYRHMKLEHLIERTEAAYCVQCDRQFNDESLFRQHIRNSRKHASEWTRPPKKKRQKPKEKQKHQCPECPNVYASNYTLRGHIDLIHKGKVNYYCSDCNKVFTKKGGYDTHIRMKHEGYRLPKDKFCDICGRGFSVARTLVHHIRTHTGERPHACALCPARFTQKSALTTHVKHVHEKMPRQTK